MLQRTIRSVPGLWASPACLDVSVVIVSYNTREVLRDCLRSLFREVGQVEFEVIVVDNCSADRSAEMVADEFPQAVLIENVENLGFAAGCNRGMAIARGRYILLLNPDTVVLDGAIAKTVAFADGRPEAAIVGCRVLNTDGTLQRTCFMYPRLVNLFLSACGIEKLSRYVAFLGRDRMTWWNRDDTREVEVVTGCYMLARREAIEEVGLMDEQFFMYAEETDWCYRMHRAGWKLLFTPSAHIIHLGGQSSQQRAAEMALQLRMSILRFIDKHCSRPVHWAARGLVAAFFGLRAPVWGLLAAFSREDRRRSWAYCRAYGRGVVKALFGGDACYDRNAG